MSWRCSWCGEAETLWSWDMTLLKDARQNGRKLLQELSSILSSWKKQPPIHKEHYAWFEVYRFIAKYTQRAHILSNILCLYLLTNEFVANIYDKIKLERVKNASFLHTLKVEMNIVFHVFFL